VERQVQLIRGENRTPVNGYLVELQQKHVDDYKNLWKNQLILHLQADKFMDWEFKLSFIRNSPNREGYAIELLGETQGLMLNPPRYKSVGTVLIQFARTRSIELGYQGRLGLHSLPGIENFYDNQRMLNLGADEDYENMVYFEYGIWRSYQKISED